MFLKKIEQEVESSSLFVNVHLPPSSAGEKVVFKSLLAPKPQRPLIGSFSGEWTWQSFQVYQNALTMAAVEQAIADRNLALSSPKSLLNRFITMRRRCREKFF